MLIVAEVSVYLSLAHMSRKDLCNAERACSVPHSKMFHRQQNQGVPGKPSRQTPRMQAWRHEAPESNSGVHLHMRFTSQRSFVCSRRGWQQMCSPMQLLLSVCDSPIQRMITRAPLLAN